MDLTPLITPILEVMAVALGGLAGALLTFGIGFIKAKTNLNDAEFEKVLADRANDIVHRGIQYAINALENEVKKPGSGISSVKVDNIFLSIALNFIVAHMPDIIRKFNLTPDKIQNMVLARIGDYSDKVQPEGAAATGTAVTTAVNAPR